jgi:hypothetical protein
VKIHKDNVENHEESGGALPKRCSKPDDKDSNTRNTPLSFGGATTLRGRLHVFRIWRQFLGETTTIGCHNNTLPRRSYPASARKSLEADFSQPQNAQLARITSLRFPSPAGQSDPLPQPVACLGRIGWKSPSAKCFPPVRYELGVAMIVACRHSGRSACRRV